MRCLWNFQREFYTNRTFELRTRFDEIFEPIPTKNNSFILLFNKLRFSSAFIKLLRRLLLQYFDSFIYDTDQLKMSIYQNNKQI